MDYILTTMKKCNIGEAVYENVVPIIIAPLVDLGADPNTADSKGNTALHYTTRLIFENVSQETVKNMCRDLEEVGASLHARNLQGETPVLFGLSEKFLGKVTKENTKWELVFTHVYEILIQNGSRLDDNDKNGNSLFHLILILFQQVLYFEMKLNKRKKALSDVADLFQLCCQADKETQLAINKRDIYLNSPLHLWSKLKWMHGFSPEEDWKNLTKIFNCLLEGGARLNARNNNDETPLHLCTTWSAVKLLLEEGANPNDLDSLGRTPLLSAALRFKERLRSNNSDLEAFYEDTSLSTDAFWKDVLQTKLDPWKADKHGQTVLGVLVESEAFVLAHGLLKAAGEIMLLESDAIAACLLNDICKDRSSSSHWKSILVEIILKARKSNIRSLRCNGETALHSCCRNVIDTFAVSQATRNDKQSSLSEEDFIGDETLASVHWTIAKQLLRSGADCTIPDAIGQSCLDIAEACPPLKTLLNGAVDMDVDTLNIPWTSISQRYKEVLSKVARQKHSHVIGKCRYHPQPIGRGSFGFIFAGINKKDGREVAIKRIEKQRMKRREDKREIQNLTVLADCERVVRYLSFSEDENFCYIFLELMEGNLDDCLENAYSELETIRLCKDVVKGLKFLHEHDILHRDLKPTNILYKTHPTLRLKIADFGLSHRMDSTSTTVCDTKAGTRCWIAPEVLTSRKTHSKASDAFACGLVLHYIFSAKKHPFSPANCVNKSQLLVTYETERNIISDNKEGWDDSLSPEATNLLDHLLESDAKKRPTAKKSLAHPLFWTKRKKADVLVAVGNQSEFEYLRAGRSVVLSAFETDLEAQFGTIVKYADWNDPGYVHMPAIYMEMTRRRRYDTHSVVGLVRFIRNILMHVSERTVPIPIRKLMLEDFVFLEYFPNLVMEVYKAVTTHGWDQTREEIKYAMKK